MLLLLLKAAPGIRTEGGLLLLQVSLGKVMEVWSKGHGQEGSVPNGDH